MDEYLRAGNLVLRPASTCCFEVVQLASEDRGILIARGEVVSSPQPSLHIDRFEPRERSVSLVGAARDSLTLHRDSQSEPADFELKATGSENRIYVLLTGHYRFRCFWWSAVFTLTDGQVQIDGPFLAPDHDS